MIFLRFHSNVIAVPASIGILDDRNHHAQSIRRATDVLKSSGCISDASGQKRVTDPEPKGEKETQEKSV